jgi:hypothetical protein
VKPAKTDLREITSSTAGLRFPDLRRHSITELAAGQASEQTIRSIAGHLSQKMLEHYLHIRLDSNRTPLDAFSQGIGKPLVVPQRRHKWDPCTIRRFASCLSGLTHG